VDKEVTAAIHTRVTSPTPVEAVEAVGVAGPVASVAPVPLSLGGR
jgi:hypothetical protein